jgi:hypothetical protein
MYIKFQRQSNQISKSNIDQFTMHKKKKSFQAFLEIISKYSTRKNPKHDRKICQKNERGEKRFHDAGNCFRKENFDIKLYSVLLSLLF